MVPSFTQLQRYKDERRLGLYSSSVYTSARVATRQNSKAPLLMEKDASTPSLERGGGDREQRRPTQKQIIRQHEATPNQRITQENVPSTLQSASSLMIFSVSAEVTLDVGYTWPMGPKANRKCQEEAACDRESQ